MEQALADILLLGTAKQVGLAIRLMREFSASAGGLDWKPLLLDLRTDIRTELNLGTVEVTLRSLRYEERKLDVSAV